MIVKVRVITNSISNEVVSRIGSVLRVKVKTKSLDDKANDILTGYLADFFEVMPKNVSIIRGAKGREKTVEISGKTEQGFTSIMESIP